VSQQRGIGGLQRPHDGPGHGAEGKQRRQPEARGEQDPGGSLFLGDPGKDQPQQHNGKQHAARCQDRGQQFLEDEHAPVLYPDFSSRSGTSASQPNGVVCYIPALSSSFRRIGCARLTPCPLTPGPRCRAFVAWALRHGPLLWLVALALAAPSAVATAKLYLHLRSDIEELLPRNAPSVLALDELRSRMPGLQYLGVLVDVGSPDKLAAGERLLDDLAARARAYPPDLVRAVRLGTASERRFIEQHLPLYLDIDDLELLRQRVEDRIHYELMKEQDMLLDDSEPPPSLDFADLEKKYQSRLDGPALAGERFSSRTLGLSLMLVEVGGFSTGNKQAKELLSRVRRDLADLGGPGHYATGMRVGFTGDVPISVEEMSALVVDLTFSIILVVGLVIVVLVLYYRWLAAVPILLAPLVLGAVAAFALASLPPWRITELNSNTAFLGSIIVGNGINFGIVLLARYVEARRRGVAVEESLAISLSGTRVGTLSASLAAAAAYASLVAMDFRGFRQFGVIGGLGMLLCWTATFLLSPSLIAWLDKGRLRPLSARAGRLRIMERLAQRIARSPVPFAVAALILTLLALLQVRHFGSDQLENDLSRLRRHDTWVSGEGYWGAKMDQLLGRQITPTVILADNVGQARAIAKRLRRAANQAPLDARISSVVTADDVLPVEQGRKRQIVERLRKKLTPRIRANLSSEQEQKLERLLGSGPLQEITAADLPDGLLTGLRERDGTLGRTILVFPRATQNTWQGAAISNFVEQLRTVAASASDGSGAPGRVAGATPLSADILSSMNRDGPLASLLAFVGVVLVVVVLFRASLATPFVIGSLMVGVVWMLAATIALGLRINFINLIAFPITFGIGVDYAVNVMGRYLQDGRSDVTAAISATGGAVSLCSATTIIGYSSLLVAQNRGLFLFGLFAVLGELTCLASAVIVLPSALLLYQRWRTGRGHSA
jgi:predicted RND superfamily exporter protein